MTARAMTTAALNALTAKEVHPVLFLEGEFATGVVNIWTGYGTITWDGKDWQGGGTFIGLSPIEETSDLVAKGFSVSLSGVPPEFVAVAIDEARQGLPGAVWLGFFDDAMNLIVDPFVIAEGFLDVPSIEDTETSCVIQITYENDLIAMKQSNEMRYTHQSQRILFPDDKAFEYVAAIQSKVLTIGGS